MVFITHTYVDMNKFKVSNDLIWTDSVASCRVYLISGIFNRTPFAYLEHHSCELGEEQATLKDLRDMLTHLSNNLKIKLKEVFQSNIKIEKLRNLKLFVAGGSNAQEKDRERESLSLMINPTPSVYEGIKSFLKGDCLRLFRNLSHKTIIISQITREKTDLEDNMEEKSKVIF